jgi:putative RNA 2'-phosphotransferase
VLRHRPDSIGLHLDAQGWADVDALLACLRADPRPHVHLSGDVPTATRVGMRHGFPVVLRVGAARMQADGILFYQSDNGVWLTWAVAPRYLSMGV